jgi:hypothetical protein
LVVKIMGMPDLSGGKWKVGSGGGGIEEQMKAGKDEL